MILDEQTVNAYKNMLSNPKEYNLPFKSLGELLIPSDKVIAKHILYNDYKKAIDRNVPKVVFYIIMDEIFPIGKAEDGNLGYFAELS